MLASAPRSRKDPFLSFLILSYPVKVFNALDADGDGLVTEAELRAAAEYRGIQLTEEQVAAFLAADADGDGVDVDEYLTSLDTSVLGEWSDMYVTTQWAEGGR
mmetsp:Transcript_12980/g.37312  ORF Transcript_12980/g.37312 Transcript_12980/m.37312 type:complete len:103 (+) Transcript_12980:2588-2896(+)